MAITSPFTGHANRTVAIAGNCSHHSSRVTAVRCSNTNTSSTTSSSSSSSSSSTNRSERLARDGISHHVNDNARGTKAAVALDVDIRRRSVLAPVAIASLLGTGILSSPKNDNSAHAFDLFGGSGRDEKYTNTTQGIIEEVRTTLALARDDDSKGPAVEQLRKDTNQWVASYRRDQSYSGRISYSNMYSALNAIAGHYNSFGTSYPIPKKRLDRILQECDVAEKALARGR